MRVAVAIAAVVAPSLPYLVHGCLCRLAMLGPLRLPLRSRVVGAAVALGAAAEALPVLAICAAATLLGGGATSMVARSAAAAVGAAGASLGVVDVVCVAVFRSRINAPLLRNLNKTTLRAYVGAGTALAVLMLGLHAAGVYAATYTIMGLTQAALASTGPGAARWAAGAVAGTTLLGVAAARRLAFRIVAYRDGEAFTDDALWVAGMTGIGLKIAYQTVLLAAWRNLARQAGRSRRRGVNPAVSRPPVAPDAAVLRRFGVDAPRVSGRHVLPVQRLVIIVMESIAREFVLGGGELPECMPFLRGLAGAATSFAEFWTANSPSDEGLFSLFNGQPIHGYLPRSRSPTSLFQCLRAAGFRSFLLRGHPVHYSGHAVEYQQWFGMDRFVGREELQRRYPGGRTWAWGMTDDVIYREAMRLLEDNRGQRTCVVVTTTDTHSPYFVPPEADRELPDAVGATGSRLLRALYGADRALQRFHSGLAAAGMLGPETLFVVTADHSPNNGEYRRWLAEEPFLHGRIPLILASSHRAASDLDARGAFGSQVDFLPTLLDLMGLPVPSSAWGRSLLVRAERPFALMGHQDNLILRFPDGAVAVLPRLVADDPVTLDEETYHLAQWLHGRCLEL